MQRFDLIVAGIAERDGVSRVEAMAAAGRSYLEVWERVRQDCRMATLADLGDLGLDDDDSDDPPPRRV